MTTTQTLLSRNEVFARDFSHADMAALPKLGSLILTCIDARVDPAHTLGLSLGDAVVFRNNGGRVTPGFIDELAALSMLVARMSGTEAPEFNIYLLQHTRCGAQAFADPGFQAQIKAKTNADVSASAITEPKASLMQDLERLRDAPALHDALSVAALLYDVDTGRVEEIAPLRRLGALRQ